MSADPTTTQPVAQPIVEPAPALAERAAPSSLGTLALAVFAVVNAWAAVAAYHAWIAPQPTRIGLVDVATVYREQEASFTAMVTGDHVTDTDRVRALDRAEAFGKRLPAALAELADACRCVLLPANAIAGRYAVVDYTADLRARVQ